MPHVKLSAEHQDLNLYYEVHGSGETKILFIMGLLTDGGAWSCQTEFFGQQSEYQCVSYDNRGCGRSSSPLTFHYTTTQMAKDALGLIDHLKWDQCHVVGVSMGGMISLELALLVPQRILSLTLLATHAGGLSGRAPWIGVRHIFRSMLIRDEHGQIQNAMDMLYGSKTLADPEKRKRFFDYHTERFRKRIPPSIIGILGHIFAVARHYIGYADLLRIRYSPCQSLIMVGTEDRLVREVNSYLLQRTLGCRLIKLQDAGHGLPGECAQKINKELLILFESIKTNGPIKSERRIPTEYRAEIGALERCCQHRTHCFVHDTVGFLKGVFLGWLLYWTLAFGLTKNQLAQTDLATRCIVLLGCLSGLRRASLCVFNALRARRFSRQHRLLLDRTTHHDNIDVILPEKKKNGIPYGCGFEFPILSLVFIVCLVGLVYWTGLFQQKV